MNKEMKNKDKFVTEMKKAYKGNGITLGAALLDNDCLIDSDSAYEMLMAKIKDFHAKKMEQQKPGRRGKAPKSTLETVVESKLARQVGRTLAVKQLEAS